MLRLLCIVLCLLSFSFFLSPAVAGDTVVAISPASTMDSVHNAIIETVGKTVSTLQTKAIFWLAIFVSLQFTITQFGLLKSGADIEAVLGKFLGSVLWFSFCLYAVENGSKFIQDVGNGFFDLGGGIFGVSAFDAAHVMQNGVEIAANLISTIEHVAGITDVGSIIIGGAIGVFILLVMAFVAMKIFLIKIELVLVIMLSPISFSLLGLNALKDQGIAPFKSLISLLYRIVLIGVIVSLVGPITQAANASLTSVYDSAGFFSKVTGIGNGVWPALLGLGVSYFIILYLAWKSDSIASSLASGGTSLGTADVASAAAIGAAAGAAVATGGVAAAATGAKTGQTMSDVIKSMMSGGSGSISNAGPSGRPPESMPVGAPPAPPTKSAAPSLSDLRSSPHSIENQNKATESAFAPTEAVAPGAGASVPGATASTASEPASSGSGASAGISGGGGATDKKLDQLLQNMGQSARPSLGDRMRDLNQHVAQEKAQTHVSISTHHSD